MSETLLLDPSEVAGTRVERDLTPYVGEEGPDFGDARIEAYLAQQQAGSIPVDFTVPDRKIAIPLVLTDRVPGVSFDEARSRIQAWVGLVQAEGGWIAREWSDGRKLFADVTEAALKLGGSSVAAWGFVDADAVLTLTAVPDWYEDWVTLDAMSATGTGQLIGVLEDGGVTAVIRGDFPLGNRCSLEVTGGTVNDQLGLVGAFRSRHYSADATAALSFEAEDLTPLDSASVVALTGAFGGNAVRHNNLGSDWTPALGTTVDATSDELTHTGQYKLVTRAYTTSATPPDVRAVWDVGDLVSPSENPPVTIPGADNFYLLDLGTIRLDRVPVGTHRWQGQIQARGESGGENVYIDRLRLEPVSEWWARLTAPINVSPGLADYVARDEFEQSSGNLTGKTAAVGGAYAALAGSDADDFAINTSDDVAQRTSTGDTGSGLNGRAVGLNLNLGDIAAQVDYSHSSAVAGPRSGLFTRVVDSSNYLAAYVQPLGGISSTGEPAVHLWTVVGGSFTQIGQAAIPSPAHEGTLTVYVFGETYIVYWSRPGGPMTPVLIGRDPALGSTLATGDVYIHDSNVTGDAVTRTYDNFKVWVPNADAAIYAGQSALLRTDGFLREDSTGTAYGPVSKAEGTLPRMPQSGAEGRPVEALFATSRGDFDELPDSGLGDLGLTPKYRPCYLTVPSS